MTMMGGGMFSLFRQMMSGGQSMRQRAGVFSRLVGSVASSMMFGPLGIGVMAASMAAPMMMASGGGGGGSNRTGTAMDQLADKLEEITSGLHRMNIQVRQASDAVGQTSSDTLKMGSLFAAIGNGNPTGSAGELASQIGRQTGAMRLGQVNQQSLMGAGILGMDPSRMMGMSPADQLSYIVEELRKMNRTELQSMETLAALEMMLPGRGQDLIAMGGMNQNAIDAQRNYERAVEAFMTGPRGRALEEQSRGLLAIAARVALQADMFEREREYLRSPFAEQRAERGAARAETGMQFGLGWQEGLQGSKVILETWARELHETFSALFGGQSRGHLRSLGQMFGEIVTNILQIVHAGVIFGSWVKDVIKLLVMVLAIPTELASGKGFQGIKEAWAGLTFQQGSMTGDLMAGFDQSMDASPLVGGDARTATGMNRGYVGRTSNRNMGARMDNGGGMVIEVRGKDDFANMMQYGIRTNTNRGRDVPGPRPETAPSIAAR